MALYTIGFAKKNLREFINRLKEAGIETIVDIRLNNTSQLAGFAKKDDLEYILKLVGINYQHLPELAPSGELFNAYKKKEINWDQYKDLFLALIKSRQIEKLWENTFNSKKKNCLLCSEDKPDKCHRRLVAEYLQSQFPDVEIKHI